MSHQKGFIEIVLIFLLLLSLWFIWPVTFLSPQIPVVPNNSFSNKGCQLADSNTPQVPIQANEYQKGAPDDEDLDELPAFRRPKGFVPDPNQPKLLYKPFLKNVVVAINNLEGDQELKELADKTDRGIVFTSDSEVVTVLGRNFRIYFPSSHTSFTLENKPPGINKPKAASYGLVFLAHVDDNNIPIIISGESLGLKRDNIITEVYQHPDAPLIPQALLDQLMAECQGRGSKSTQVKTNNHQPQQPTGPSIIFPNQKSQDKSQLQLEYFLFEGSSSASIAGVWRFHCKPAIYLYPEKESFVNVKVLSKGLLTYTDPIYPLLGWITLAKPDGRLVVDGKEYKYLYYESKVPDSEIKKPGRGFVVPFDELPNFYSRLLPQLGLDDEQTKDFKSYWERTLPKSPYYFVGVMEQKNIDAIEPLIITPKPDTVIRVRLYFEALDKEILVDEPKITTPLRSGFTVVEWGGMVKTDKDDPFTCSQ